MTDNDKREDMIKTDLDGFRELDHEIVCRFATVYKATLRDLCDNKSVSMNRLDEAVRFNFYKTREVANEVEA